MNATDLCFLTIAEVGRELRSGDCSPVDLVQACLARIESVDDKIHSFITVTTDLALQEAQQAERELHAGRDRGPLHGVPIALKDLYATKGIRTTCHSAVLQHWVPDHDAAAVTRLRAAGAVLLGKLAMHEFAFGGPPVDAPFPAVRNPWNAAHIPGGSSSGCGAALAAGFCFGALGSDTGGSIRTPSSHCSIVGLKPTYGRVSRYGMVPLSWSLDHAGPMARSVEDCALLVNAIAGYDPADPASADVPVSDCRADLLAGIKHLRIGVPRNGWFSEGHGTDPETGALFAAALDVLVDLGATITEIEGRPFAMARKANQIILVAEAYAYHERRFQEVCPCFGSSVQRIQEGAFISAADYIAAQRARTVLTREILRNFSQVDIIATPTTPAPPEAFEGYDATSGHQRPSFTNPFNLAGLPALSVPCGLTQSGLPVGLQIVAPPFHETLALRAAYAYEQATEWHKRRPPV